MNRMISSFQWRASWSWAKVLSYGLFLGLLTFELLNILGVLSYHVDFTWLGRVISSLAVFGIIVGLNALFERLLRIPISNGVLLGGTLLLLVDFWGDVLSLYTRFPWYDQVAHFLSGPFLVGAFLLVYEPVIERLRWRIPQGMVYFFTLQTSVLLAVLYELEEYTEDLLYGTNRLGDGMDTANDLALNLLGGLVTLLIVIVYRRRQQQKQL